MYHHKMSLTDIEQMLPFEREVYLMLLTQQIKKENELKRQAEENNRRR